MTTNKVELEGRVYNAEFKTYDKFAFLRMRLLVPTGFNDLKEFHTVKVFGGLGEKMKDVVSNGDTIKVLGVLRASEFTDRNNNKKVDIFVSANNVDIVDNKSVNQADNTDKDSNVSMEEKIPF